MSDPDWLARDPEVCWHPYTQHGLEPLPLPVARAEGAWLELADGTRTLDGISSWWACLHGHARPALVTAISQQAATLDHVLFAGCTHRPAVALAEKLIELAAPMADGQRALSKVFFSDNGSTAVEVAMKCAWQACLRLGQPQRTRFIALEGAYHGDTFGAMAAGEPEPFFAEFDPLLFQVIRIPPRAEALQAALEAHPGAVAALIVEPLVQGANCMSMYSADFLRAARRLCDEHGSFFIADEVMTGFGRTGATFACQRAGICPDLICLAKGLTGGMFPLSVTMVTERLYQAFYSDDRSRTFFHGHTFTANPIGCAVALASMELLEREDTPARLNRIGEIIEADLADLRDQPICRELRRTGGIVALELADPGRTGYLAGERLRQICRETMEVLLRPLGNVIYALPPSCVTDEEAHLIARKMREIALRVAAG